jgi:hypothetical protein
LEITKTVLSLMLVMITILTAITTTITAAYAGGGDDDDNGDGNKQKAEDDSSAAIADCDKNDVERAGFDCIAIAANDVEVEPPKSTLSVCKVEFDADFSPEDFTFTVTGNNPSPRQFEGSANCVDVTIGPGEYTVSETAVPEAEATQIINSNCVQDPNNRLRATGEIQAGETQICSFLNFSPN